MARILVIEDDTSISHLVRMVLEGGGHEVLLADDGSRGFATARRRSPDAIVLDVMMPYMDGFAVLEALREDERTSTIPVVMLSAEATPGYAQRLVDAGAYAYLTKPLDVRQFMTIVDELVADARARETASSW